MLQPSLACVNSVPVHCVQFSLNLNQKQQDQIIYIPLDTQK